VTATRLVKTGSMSLTVDKGQVGAAISSLVAMTRSLGGFVSNSHTDDIDGSPSGEVTLRMPVNNFEQAVTRSQKIGHQTSLSTSAHDVTGKYVDLHARLIALQRTRQTYLTILSRATTIGEILSVQQRVDDTQSQIERLQGELKVLRNQSADRPPPHDLIGPNRILRACRPISTPQTTMPSATPPAASSSATSRRTTTSGRRRASSIAACG
jgi:hypothetical protein